MTEEVASPGGRGGEPPLPGGRNGAGDPTSPGRPGGAGDPPTVADGPSLLGRAIGFFLRNKLITAILLVLWVGGGIVVAPFDWKLSWPPRRPVPVDAIPNLGENQQIVFAEWPGRSPQDVEDQVTYPLTAALLGVPGVKEVRSASAFGFAMVFLVFAEEVDFYWSRTRILERLNSLPPDLLPPGVRPSLGPDATALGQVFWYTLEGRDPRGNPVGGWDLDELRSVQDWLVRYVLLSAEGIAEVASVGGFVREYLVEVDRDALRIYGVTLEDVLRAAAESNLDVGAGATEISGVEYLIRGRGFLKGIEDLEQAVVRTAPGFLPIRLKDVARVSAAPAPRRGALTVGGAEAVGGVVVVREGYNPLQAIQNVKARLAELAPGLPAKAVVDWTLTDRDQLEAFAQAQGFEAFQGSRLHHEAWVRWLRTNPREAWPVGVTLSQLQVVPVYDRTGLIKETLGTLNDALVQQVLVTVLVVVLMLLRLQASLVVSATLPLAVLGAFMGMKLLGVQGNVVALAGIAIAIGTIVDMGLILSENVTRHLEAADPSEDRLEVVWRGSTEVGGAVLAAISTTIVGFLPVFAMTGPEGKMFTPLAFTKTLALLASVLLALFVVPPLLHLTMARRNSVPPWLCRLRRWAVDRVRHAPALAGFSGLPVWTARLGSTVGRAGTGNLLVALAGLVLLARVWEPLGPEGGNVGNLLFVTVLVGGVLGFFFLVRWRYAAILEWALEHRAAFLSLPLAAIGVALLVWLGWARLAGVLPSALDRLGLPGDALRFSRPWTAMAHAFPGLGREFMPTLDEGAFLWMPTTMPHASLGEALEILRQQDLAIASVPEVDAVVGKIGRAESALDPAPVSMIETLVTYKPEFVTDENGRRIRFRYDRQRGEFVRDGEGNLIPDERGRPFRQWREHIRSPEDIWNELVRAARMPGVTSAPKLQPIETRQVMLQTGMRASMGIKLRAPDLETLDRMAVELERWVRQVPAVRRETVNAERVMGKPYLVVEPDREAIARLGLSVEQVQRAFQAAVEGVVVTRTVEGRERYPVRVRYARERRSEVNDLEDVLLAVPGGGFVPLGQVARVSFVRGPDMIRSEDTFLTAYITFGGIAGLAEVEVVEAVREFLEERVRSGDLVVPPGVSWRFAGTYERQQHAAATLRVVIPVALLVILLILYLQFRSLGVSLMIFGGIAVAWAGGFLMIWLYGKEGLGDFTFLGVNPREVFQLRPVHLSVAVWVGFLALFGIAVDDGVLIGTYLDQRFRRMRPRTVQEVRRETVQAGLMRVRPAVMTSATTILALFPVLTSTGRGAEIMIPMAIPTVGGMTLAVLTMFTVPVLWAWREEARLGRIQRSASPSGEA